MTLDLIGCSSLKELPETLGNLTSLVDIGLDWLLELEGITRDIGQLDFIGYIGLE